MLLLIPRTECQLLTGTGKRKHIRCNFVDNANCHRAAAGEPQEASIWTVVAEIGSLSLEFTRLTQVSGDPKYFDAIQRITDYFDSQQNLTQLPGMWPIGINAKEAIFTGDITGENTFTVGALSDSLYEYLPKARITSTTPFILVVRKLT